jgi:hypothetical protein
MHDDLAHLRRVRRSALTCRSDNGPDEFIIGLLHNRTELIELEWALGSWWQRSLGPLRSACPNGVRALEALRTLNLHPKNPLG